MLAACLSYLGICPGVFAWRNNTGAARLPAGGGRTMLVRFGLVGSSDVLAVLPGGRMAAFEVKRPGGRATEAQERFLAELRSRGAVAEVVTSVDELRAALRRAGVQAP